MGGEGQTHGECRHGALPCIQYVAWRLNYPGHVSHNECHKVFGPAEGPPHEVLGMFCYIITQQVHEAVD